MGHLVVGDAGGYCRLGHGREGASIAKLDGEMAFTRTCCKAVKLAGGTDNFTVLS
ncbi:hypothetical protein [Photorhabdus caribbeanensis]|uniref:hypothetical protein n=1 Tax=Photorhabdus caribbeanensis TaxID=1004165 RepID=UPI001FE7B89B|nr:hypothetical protein [Photorhabdus caribbeanensis]